MKKGEIKQILYLISVIIFIFLLIIAIVFLIKNKDLIVADPIHYGMQAHNFTFCSCSDGLITVNFEQKPVVFNKNEKLGLK